MVRFDLMLWIVDQCHEIISIPKPTRHFVYLLNIPFVIAIREILPLEHIGQLWRIRLSRLILFVLRRSADLKTVALQKHFSQIANWQSISLYIQLSIEDVLRYMRECIPSFKMYEYRYCRIGAYRSSCSMMWSIHVY